MSATVEITVWQECDLITLYNTVSLAHFYIYIFFFRLMIAAIGDQGSEWNIAVFVMCAGTREHRQRKPYFNTLSSPAHKCCFFG